MERNTNLFVETVNALARHGHTFENIEFVSLYGMEIDPDEFVRFASDFNYDAGYGREYVPPFFIVMSDGTWYERGEYDGSEWWRFQKAPNSPKLYGSITEALDGADVAWMYERAYEHAENTAYEVACAEELAEYEAALLVERMDAYSDEYEFDGVLDATVVPSKKDWHDGKGKCAYKSRCTREVWDESRYGTHIRWATKHNSKCWKDQRGKGRRRRDTQYRA